MPPADDLLSDPPAPPPGAPPAAPPAAPPTTPPSGGAAPATPPASTPPASGTPPVVPPANLAPDPNKEFLKTLPADLQENASLARYSSPESLARAYINLERTLGSEKVPIPKDPNDQAAWDRYYAAGGRPEEPKAYQFVKPEKLPEGVAWDDNMEGWWRQAAFESGLSQRQAQKLVDQYRDRYIAQVDLQNKQVGTDITKGKAELQRDWGNEYEAKRALARAAFAEMPAALQESARNSGLARMPAFVKYLYDQKVALTGEREPRPPGDPANNSPDAIRNQIATFRNAHDAALKDATHPEHAMRLAELTALHNRLFVEPAAA